MCEDSFEFEKTNEEILDQYEQKLNNRKMEIITDYIFESSKHQNMKKVSPLWKEKLRAVLVQINLHLVWQIILMAHFLWEVWKNSFFRIETLPRNCVQLESKLKYEELQNVSIKFHEAFY